jgi:transglutaminase-like putative cysteine protease
LASIGVPRDSAVISFLSFGGVCQDFSHIMISGMRSLVLPVAYVSGYLRTFHKSDEARLEGSDSMHAWALAWCGADAGWIGLDPTNGILAGNDHVVLAIGPRLCRRGAGRWRHLRGGRSLH